MSSTRSGYNSHTSQKLLVIVPESTQNLVEQLFPILHPGRGIFSTLFPIYILYILFFLFIQTYTRLNAWEPMWGSAIVLFNVYMRPGIRPLTFRLADDCSTSGDTAKCVHAVKRQNLSFCSTSLFQSRIIVKEHHGRCSVLSLAMLYLVHSP